MLPPRRHEPTRLEAFSDAVFAFALTLLVVALDVPVGALALAVALFAPLRIVFISPMMFMFMAPAHGWYGMRAGRQRAALEAELIIEREPLA